MNQPRRNPRLSSLFPWFLLLSLAAPGLAQKKYLDHRPSTSLRMDAKDAGPVLRYGNCPGDCDKYGARDVWVFQSGNTYYMHYDAAGPRGWLVASATSTDLIHWTKHGTVLDLGPAGSGDSASASYGTTYYDGAIWHMFYLGTPHVTPPPDRVPMFPYLTMKARSVSPAGPWIKQPDVIPFRPVEGTYYSVTASPGFIIRYQGEYLQFFSASMDHPVRRTISIARTKNLNGPWKVDPKPVFPSSEQVENSSIYFEPANKTWFLFTNHVGIDADGEYTDAVWVFWTRDPNHWDEKNKAIVLDKTNSSWAGRCVGLPSVVKYKDQLAVFYDAPGGDSISHMKRSIGLAWLPLPLQVPKQK